MAEFFMCLECQLQPPFVIMWLKLPKCPLPTLSTPKKSLFLWPSPFNMSFLWNDYILPFTSSLSQQCREYLLCLSSRWAIARASYCYVLILWRNLFQPFSIFDLQSLPIYLNPASVPGGSSKTRFARYYTLPGASKHVFPSRAARKPQEIPSMEPFLHHRQPVSPATTFILLLTASTSKCPPKVVILSSIILKWKSELLK